MPGMTGINLSREILAMRPDTPIILCTGYSSIISEDKVKAIGIREYIMKPVTQKTIAGLMRKVLDAG
jgi:CheY-like chemotaxis protein